MRIKRLELRGFKSFVEPTVFHLGPGIAAVVGPNGCGKSNVIDAIRWTLGEQSPGTLRGKAMSDVIFSGAEGRSPANVAEVTLVFDNADASFGGRFARFSDIEVTRRLDRSGASTYAINRQKCRLKDVVSLFVDTGVGARAYSIIEQGRVGFVVGAKPEERRLLIDEVAGVNRFKGQRSEAERRMKETAENLLRVADLETEMDRQRTSLGEQARKAERFLALRAQWKSASVRGAVIDAADQLSKSRALASAFAQASGELERLVGAESNAASEANEARSRAEAVRGALSEHRARVATLRAQVRADDVRKKERAEEADDLAARVGVLEGERAELLAVSQSASSRQAEAQQTATTSKSRLVEARVAVTHAQKLVGSRQNEARALRASREEAKQRQLEAMTGAARQRNSVTLLRRRLEDLAEDRDVEARTREEAANRGAHADAQLETAREALAEAAAKRSEAKTRRDGLKGELQESVQAERQAGHAEQIAASALAATQAALDSERELVRSLAGAQPGLRALVDWLRGAGAATAAGRGYLGVVADLLGVPEGLAAPVELALGDLVDAAVFLDRASLQAAVRWIEETSPGRAVLLHLNTPTMHGGLAAGLESDAVAPDLAAQLLGGVSLAEQLSELPRLDGTQSVHLPSTRSAGAVVRVGGVDVQRGLLTRRAKLRSLSEEVEVAKASYLAAGEHRRAAEARSAAARSATADATTVLHRAELGELGSRRDLEEAEKRKRSAAEEEVRGAQRRARLEDTTTRLAQELERTTEDLAATEQRKDALDGELDRLRGLVDAAEQAVAEATSAGTRVQVALSDVRHDAASAERDLRRLNEEAEQRRRRIDRLGKDLTTANRRSQRLALRAAESSESSEVAARELSTLEAGTADLEARAEAAAGGVEVSFKEHAALRAALERQRRTTSRLEAEVARAAAQSEFARTRAAEDFELDLAQVAAELLDTGRVQLSLASGPGRPPTELTLDAQMGLASPKKLRAEASRLGKEADALGAVNMAAAEEFAEVDARWRELRGQHEDLDAALADLRRAIRRIEQETRQRFRTAFDAVAQRFSALYPRLVGGGRAELTLTAPDNLLATGVEIRVEPPGKRLQNLQLLSGGEKAMAAIAFVFAIFEVKPSPFCLLDEVDAPLDESNSRRFNGMLAELSATTQFVVITHNRTTMEVADVLYGVTMQAAGVSSVVSVRVDEASPTDTMRGPSGEEHA